MLKLCPSCVDVTDLHFKLQCRLKIFKHDDISPFPNVCNLLTCASRYGLLFVGTNSKHFQVIQTQDLHRYTPKDKDVTDYPRRNIDIPSSPKHLCVNCDNTILAVVVEKDQCSIVIFYEVLSFLTQNVKIIKEIRLSPTPNIYVREINWNPSLSSVFTACKSDGTLGVYELKGESVDINELPAASGATCFCWSPKGKQIAVGSKDGKITQYKPDLKAVKVINEPQLGDPHSLINLQWVSNYQFIGIYQSMKPEGSSCVIVIDAPKTGEPSYTNYDDICYSGSSRPPQFYLILQQNWHFLMVASANSSEVVVLGNTGDTWTQWIMSDTARAELPLSPDHQETLPVGLTFDISSTTSLPWGESDIPPCPLLCILSDHGVLCCFNVVYLKENIPSVCTPADSVKDTSGLATFITKSEGINTNVTKVEVSKPVLPSLVQPQFGLEKKIVQTMNPPVSKDTFLLAPKVTISFTTPTQSTPLVPGKATADISSKTLFGGQATLTPIKPPPSSQSASLFGGQTLITPINKGPNTSISQTTNYNNEKYASIFSSLNPTTVHPTSTIPVKPIVISPSANAAKSEAAIKSQVTSTAKLLEFSALKETSKPITPTQECQVVDPKLKAETSAMLTQMIKDEWMYLEAELKVLLNQGRALKIILGSDEEKVDMIAQIGSLQEFLKEAVDISVGQNSEIHCLKQNLIQAWAWFEEANSYYNSSKNEAVALLLKLQPLDSVSQKRLKDIEQLTYYIESQLYQTSKTLDEQWGNFQDYAKKTHRVQMPTMEAIFQTMVRQSAILQKQTYVLKDISMRLKKKTFGVSSLLLSLDRAENLADDLRELHLDAQDILQLQYEKIKNYSKILSNKKANMLRLLLKQRKVTHVTAVKPQLSSWTINQSPASKIRPSISLSGAHVSPVAKIPVAKNLSFIQSTPLKVSEASKPAQVSQTLSFSVRTMENPSFSVSSSTSSAPSGFVSLAKSGPDISNSQSSAFAPIGFTPTTSAVSDSQQFLHKTTLPPMSFSFGSSTANTSKPIPNITQVKSNFTIPAVSSTPALVTGVASGQTINMGGSTNSVFKSVSDSTVRPQSVQSTTATTNFSFSFGAGVSSMKNAFGITSVSSSSSPAPDNVFSSSSSSGSVFATNLSGASFSNSNTQVVKPTNVTTINGTNTSNIKLTQSPPSSSIFGSQQSSFVSLNKSSSVTTMNTTVTTTTAPKTTSGVASIFANLQSVIDKATGSSGATTTSVETSKPTLSFSISNEAVTTTTQSLFVPMSSTSTTKSIFGTTTFSTGGNLFGNISKPVEGSTSASPTPPTSLFGNPPNPFIATTTSANKPETIMTPSNTPNSLTKTESSKDSSGVTSTVLINTSSSKNIELSTPPITTPITIFGQKPTSPPNNTSVSLGVLAATSTVPAPSIFGTNATASVPKPVANIFGASVTTSTTTLTGTVSVFESPKTTSSTVSSGFGTTVQSTPIFENAPNITTLAVSSTSESNIFSSSTPTLTSNVFVPANAGPTFGNSDDTAKEASDANAFSSTPTSASAFGTSTSGKNIFGVPSTTSASTFLTPTTSVFGTPTTSTHIFSSSGSIFGTTPISPTTNVFGTPASTGTSVFGTSTSTSSTNIFGGLTSASTTPNIFGNTTSVTTPFGTQSSSIFGTPKTTGSVFGQQDNFGNQATTTSSIFGQPASFGSGTSSFGSSTTTTPGNIFGNATSSGNEFGSSFGTTSGTNTFGSIATSQTPSAGSFGFGSLNVGSTSSSTGSIFGTSPSNAFGATPAANPFGKVENKPPFGSNSSTNIFGNSTSGAGTANIFASPATTTNSIFGSSSETFGTNNAGGGFGSSGTFGSSAFGQKSVFGQQTTFGSTTFGSPQAGSFSGGTTSPVGQSGFGAPATFQKPSGFGSPPVFGSSPTPAFGATPSFGGAPAFGGAATFGTPEKVFGTSQPASGGFGATTTQQSAGFGNLASQNTIGFGSLAQQASTTSSSPFSSGNSSFSSWR